jgi:uncharacterized protein
MTSTARLIKEARTTAGLTQAALARRAGTSQPTVAAYESGEKVPNADTLERLLRAAGRSISSEPSAAGPRTESLRDLLGRRRAEVIRIAAAHHATNVRVFGSVARGEETDRSDVDLLVDMEAGRSLLEQVRLRRALSELLGIELDLVTSGGLLERDHIEEAGDAAQELVARGKDAWDADRLLRLAGEAVIGRIADAANRLPQEVKAAVPEIPWEDLRDIRIVVDRIHHRVDPGALWVTLAEDVPELVDRLRRWRNAR